MSPNPDSNTRPLHCWQLSDASTGNIRQCEALIHYLRQQRELSVSAYQLTLRQPWDALAPHLTWGLAFGLSGDLAAAIEGPPPDLVVACGRRAALPARCIKARHGPAVRVVQILDPRIPARHFDRIICPEHDGRQGQGVINTLGSLHAIDAQTLSEAHDRWADRLSIEQAPSVAVLIGGDNRAYRLDRAYLMQMKRCADQLLGRDRQADRGRLLVSASRRSSPALLPILREVFGSDALHASDLDDNPYLGFLATADALVVSADSVNMISEALGTGKPVFSTPPVSDSNKFDRFHQRLNDRGYLLPFTAAVSLDRLQHSYPALRETEQIAARLIDELGLQDEVSDPSSTDSADT